MCFYADFYYESQTKVNFVTTKPTKCYECRRMIPEGITMIHNSLQEHEECNACNEGECECPDGACCECDEPEYGETLDYDICQECSKFLEAMTAAEIEVGCDSDESQPPVGMMLRELYEIGRDECNRYFNKAKLMYPELVEVGYLNYLEAKLFKECKA